DRFDSPEQLFETKQWVNTFLPDAQRAAGQEQIDTEKLGHIAYEIAMAKVEDHSSMNRSAEQDAWNLVWSKLMEPKNFDLQFRKVTYLHLSGQPQSYRGKPIQIHGNVRGIEKINLPPDHVLGLKHYYVLWVKPNDSNRVPFCVYSDAIPDSFPDVDTGFTKAHEDVLINGIFFKTRTFITTAQRVESCPLIVANRIQPFATKASNTEFSTTWLPPAWAIATVILLMPIVSSILAWKVYQSTKPRQLEFPDTSIESHLDQLSNEPAFLTDLEKIDKLKKMDTQGPADSDSENA
ncbi:MAG: hypothetical protein AAGA30_01510, partial [Planctomycetota bacterium]